MSISEISSLPSLNAEVRPPHSVFEDMGVSLTVVPQRYLYMSEAGIQGYHVQREKDGLDKEFRLIKEVIDKWLLNSSEIIIADIGAGDGYKAALLVNYIVSLNKSVEYWAIDASPHMIAQNRSTLESVVSYYRAIETTWEAFAANDKVHVQKPILWLMLGNTYFGFEPKKMLPLLADLLSSPNDLLCIGGDTWQNKAEKVDLVCRDFVKYSDYQMRQGCLKLLGIDSHHVKHNVMWNDARNQFEMYVCITEKQAHYRSLGLLDILLMGVGRRIERTDFNSELNQWFDAYILNNKNIDTFLTLGVCAKK